MLMIFILNIQKGSYKVDKIITQFLSTKRIGEQSIKVLTRSKNKKAMLKKISTLSMKLVNHTGFYNMLFMFQHINCS